MPILLVFALVAACLPIEWPEPPADPPLDVALALSGGGVALVLTVAFALRTWVVQTLRRDPARRIEVAQVYGRLRRALFFVNISVAAACVLAFGWGWVVQREFVVEWGGRLVLAPFAEFAVPLPYFVILVGCWVIYYDAERALHRALHGPRPFSPRLGHLFHNARQFALMAMMPVTLLVGQQTLGRFAPELTRSDPYRVASLAVVPLLLLFMPLLLKPFLGLKSMPAGPVRERLEAVARRLNFRCADFLLWPTHGAAANAMIAGLLPRVRYVIFTDRILDDLPPDELDAVLGHEIGHAKHAHLWLYVAFLMLSLSMLTGVFILLEQALAVPTSEEWVWVRERLEAVRPWALLLPVATIAAYLFVVFGALSRRCERQADIYGCKAVSCGDPGCTGHDGGTVFPPGGNCLCPTGIRTCVRALERVADLHGIQMTRGREPLTPGRLLRGAWEWGRAWLHAPMPRRVAYLLTLIDRPALEPRFQRGVFAFKCVLMLALAAALVALGQAVGWKNLLNEM
jgi:Zn-dependent protease with chaperone function